MAQLLIIQRENGRGRFFLMMLCLLSAVFPFGREDQGKRRAFNPVRNITFWMTNSTVIVTSIAVCYSFLVIADVVL